MTDFQPSQEFGKDVAQRVIATVGTDHPQRIREILQDYTRRTDDNSYWIAYWLRQALKGIEVTPVPGTGIRIQEVTPNAVYLLDSDIGREVIRVAPIPWYTSVWWCDYCDFTRCAHLTYVQQEIGQAQQFSEREQPK